MRILFTIVLIICCISGSAQETDVILTNKQYGAHRYKISRGTYPDSAVAFHYTRNRINITRDGKIIDSMWLPVPDDEAKNFGVNAITEIPDGFMIEVDWGGGNYFYNNTYYFAYKAGHFYLRDIDWHCYTQTKDKTESYSKKLKPLISFSNVSMLKYLWKD